MKTETEMKIIQVPHKPTTQNLPGTYKVIDASGIYWGTYYVGMNWCGKKFVAEADPRDGLPY